MNGKDFADLGLAGKVALVTAASEGLGFACARRLMQAGCHLAICGRRPATLAEAQAALQRSGPGEVVASRCDIAEAPDLENLLAAVLQRFGRIDLLVVNSGHVAYGGLEELNDEQWRAAFDLVLMSAVRLARGVVPAMRAQGGGDIVFLGSSTIREPPAHLLLSTAMRLGVAGLAKTLAREVAADGIRVNLVAPGYFDTGRVRARIDAVIDAEGLDRPAATKRIAGDIPTGRIGAAEELAELVAFVASRKAGFMTGSILTIDGAAGRAFP